MKKALIILTSLVSVAVFGTAMGAVSVKKAAPVATKASSGANTGASLLPTVLSMYTNIQQVTSKDKAMTAECEPTAAEIQFVNNMVKEWAKTGAATAQDAEKRMKTKPCDGTTSYETSVANSVGTNGDMLECFEYFHGTGNDGNVWARFPMASKAQYCSDGSPISGCPTKNRRVASNIYSVFSLIDFEEADYTPQELTMAKKLQAKSVSCAPEKLSARKRQMWAEFLTGTISGVGTKTNTGSIMETVGAITQSGGGLGALGSLGSVAAQFMQ